MKYNPPTDKSFKFSWLTFTLGVLSLPLQLINPLFASFSFVCFILSNITMLMSTKYKGM